MANVIRYGFLTLLAALSLSVLASMLGLFPPSASKTKQTPTLVPFALVDQNNVPVGREDVLGRPAVVFFGFTYCPEICPTTLAALTVAMAKLGHQADRVGVYLVTVDPERDTPDLLKQYMSPFDPRIKALTGKPAEVAALAHGLGVFYQRSSTGASYSIDHTASILLLDAEGRTVETISAGDDPKLVNFKGQL